MSEVAMTSGASSETFQSLPSVGASQPMYNEEYVRLASYNSMNPLEGCHPVLMARAGLYYTGSDDYVQCYSCSKVLSNWRLQGIDPVNLHRQTSPDCLHTRGEDSTNAAITAPDASATTRIKEMLRQKCAELDQNPTQVYFNICQSFNEIGGVSRGEMFGSGTGLESIGSAVLAEPVAVPLDHGGGEASLEDVNTSENAMDRPRLNSTSSPAIDFELCKTCTEERLKTFERWPQPAQVPPLLLAEAGFVYTGPSDRVQCVHCEGSLRNWQTGDVPSLEHARHFPTCPMIRNSQTSTPTPAVGAGFGLAEHSRNTPPPVSGMGAADGTTHGPSVALPGAVIDRPKHLGMSIEAARIGSFVTWPTGKSQTPQQLAKAGFFYAGFNDSVKCFFCDGGLRNWEREDDPWHEHARWFPQCKYVRLVKGGQFVERVLLEENSRVQQTATYEGPEGDSSPQAVGEVERSRSGSGSTGRDVGERWPAVEPREVMARMDTPLVRAVLNMDIPQEMVRQAIEHRLRNTGDDFPSMEALLETVFELSGSHHAATRHSGSGGPSPVNTGSPARRPASGEHLMPTEAPRSLIEENRQLKEQRTCKICMDEEVCVVFVPCGHLVCCGTCAPPLSKCPICRSTIRGTVRTYMS